MKNLRLLPDIHGQQKIIKAAFAYDRELIDLVKKQEGACWSQSLKTWYFIKKDFQLNRFYRHCFATHLMEQGVSLRHIQVLLGHNSSKTTERYTQVPTREIGRIVNPLDTYYNLHSGTIHPKTGCIVPPKQRYNGNKHHKGVYIH